MMMLLYTVVAEEPSPVPLCNGERIPSKPVDDNTNSVDGHESKTESPATASDDTASTSVVDVNERLRPSSVVVECHSLPATDADISSSRSSTNDTSLSSGKVSSLPQLASSGDIGQSVVAQP